MRKVVIFLIFVFIMLIGLNMWAQTGQRGEYSLNKALIQQIKVNVSNYTPIEKIPLGLIRAVVAVEDQRFYKHFGFDLVGITRALASNVKEREIREGGSTITQQLVKNLFFTGERTLERKIKELVLAIRLEQLYSKNEILEMYFNAIYYGDGAYGVQNASLAYFNKNVWELSLNECALLAGLPQAPSRYNPNIFMERAKERQQVVFKRMAERGDLGDKAKSATF